MDTFDITSVFNALLSALVYAVTWSQTHYIKIGEATVSFFNIEVAAIALVLIMTRLPIWGDYFDGEEDALSDGDYYYAFEPSDYDFDDYDD